MSAHDPFPPRDEANPYAPPETDLAPTLPGSPLAAAQGLVEPFTVGEVIGRAWRIYQARFGTCIAIVIGVGAINVGYSIAGNLLLSPLTAQRIPPAAFVAAQIAFMLGSYALSFWLTAGETLALIKLARDQDASFDDVFSGGRYFWRFVGSTLLVGLIAIPILIVCAIPAGIAALATMGVQDTTVRIAAIAAGAVVGFVAFYYVMLRLYLYSFVLIDRDCGAVEAIQGSYEITRGHVLTLFSIGLVGGLIGLAGVLACGIGLIFTFPLSMLIMSCAYVCLTGTARTYHGKLPRTDIEFTDDAL